MPQVRRRYERDVERCGRPLRMCDLCPINRTTPGKVRGWGQIDCVKGRVHLWQPTDEERRELEQLLKKLNRPEEVARRRALAEEARKKRLAREARARQTRADKAMNDLLAAAVRYGPGVARFVGFTMWRDGSQNRRTVESLMSPELAKRLQTLQDEWEATRGRSKFRDAHEKEMIRVFKLLGREIQNKGWNGWNVFESLTRLMYKQGKALRREKKLGEMKRPAEEELERSLR